MESNKSLQEILPKRKIMDVTNDWTEIIPTRHKIKVNEKLKYIILSENLLKKYMSIDIHHPRTIIVMYVQ